MLENRIAPPVAAEQSIQAVIFDMDGTLVDSEHTSYLADHLVMGALGIPFTEEEKRRFVGRSTLDTMRDLVRRHGLALPPEVLAARKETLYMELAKRESKAFPAMRRFLAYLLEYQVPVALASGSTSVAIPLVLKAAGLDALLPLRVSADEVAKGKPAPDVFLETARRLEVAPAACLVVEDSVVGVEAALAARMRCIAVPSVTDLPLPSVFAQADLLFPKGMASFDPLRCWAWVAERLDESLLLQEECRSA